MKSGSVALNNFLLSVQGLSPANTPIAPVANYWVADLFSVTRLDGVKAWWTSWGLPLTVGIRIRSTITVTGAVWSGGVGTFTVNSTAALTPGETISVDSVTPSGFNFDNLSATIVDGVTFSVSMPDPGAAYYGGGSVATIATPQTFSAFGPYIRRSSISWGTGLDNKQMKILLGADSTMRLGPAGRVIPVIQSLAQDLFAGATVRVDRLVMPTPGDTSLGTYNLWLGNVGDVAVKRASAEITVDSELIKLNVQVPRTVYSPGCRHVFGDSSCTVNLATVTDSGIAQAGSNRFVIASNLAPPADPLPPSAAPTITTFHNSLLNLPARRVWVVVTYTYAFGPGETVGSPEASPATFGPSILAVVTSPPPETNATGYNVYIGGAPGDEMLQNDVPIAIGTNFTEPSSGFTQGLTLPISGFGGYYAQGVIKFTSGVLNGLSRQVQASDSSGNLTLSSGFPQAPAPGDTFTVRRGCARTVQACNTFSNLINFGGQPFIPQPESAS